MYVFVIVIGDLNGSLQLQVLMGWVQPRQPFYICQVTQDMGL